MNTSVVTLKLNSEKAFTILHITDSHLALADGRDGKRKTELAAKRAERFGADAEKGLIECASWAKQNNALLVHTGDLYDFVSRKNLEFAKRFTGENDCFFTAGNHEFSLYVGEAFEDEKYRSKSLPRVQAVFKNDIRFASRVQNGVNLVAIDDSYYRFDASQLNKLKAEAERGLPILLFLHTPLFSRELYDYIMLELKENCAGLLGVPPELLTPYSEHRLRQQAADEITLEAFEYIKSCPLIKAVFSGHLHFSFESPVTSTLPQYVTGGSYNGEARIIRINN